MAIPTFMVVLLGWRQNEHSSNLVLCPSQCAPVKANRESIAMARSFIGTHGNDVGGYAVMKGRTLGKDVEKDLPPALA